MNSEEAGKRKFKFIYFSLLFLPSKFVVDILNNTREGKLVKTLY